MPKPIPTLRSVALGVLRRVRGWTGRDLAQAAEVSETLISYYESGHRCPSHKVLLALAATMGFTEDQVTCILFGLAGVAAPSDRADGRPLSQEQKVELRRRAVRVGLAAAQAEEERLLEEARARRAEEERRRAEGHFRQLLKQDAPQRDSCIDRHASEIDWALVERICEESERAAASDPQLALSWANLAVHAAGLAPGSPTLRSRLQGYAWAFLGNARRVASHLPGADEAFQTAWKLWRKGGSLADPPPLGEWYLYDLEASLRRAQRDCSRAMVLHGRALARTQLPVQRGVVLLNLARSQETFGDFERAISSLSKANPLIDDAQNPRLRFVLLLNLAVCLERSGRAAQAADLLPEARELATRLRSEVDLIRTVWLRARIDLALGQRKEGLDGLEQVRRFFCAQEIAYDAALAALESAVLLLEDGCLSKVRELSEEIVWIFQSQGVGREAIAALRLFCQAAVRQEATLGLAQDALRELRGRTAVPG